MRERGESRRWRWLACLALLTAGCESQDADRLAKLGRKVADRLQAQTTIDPGRPPDSLQSIRGGIGEFALDAKVAARLHWDKALEGTRIQVAALGEGTVKLTGMVPSAEARQQAVHLARTTSGVRDVVDELTESRGR
jgi:osmotically-inducible protein OsmY